MSWPLLPASDPGFRFGLGIFATLRVARGRALFEKEHRQGFNASAEALGLRQVAWEDLGRPGDGDGLWRWFHTPDRTFSAFESGLPPLPESCRLELSSHRLSSSSWEARHKTLSYLLRWQARKEAEAGGFDEAVLRNERGEVCSACMANLFWVKDGLVHTPPESVGCRPGVVRSWVMQQADVRQSAAHEESLAEADELFLTNSRVGVWPVSRWIGRELAAGPVAAGLREAFAAAIA